MHIYIQIRFMNTVFFFWSMAVLTPQEQEVEFLEAGEVGYMMAGIKTVEDARVGDTITHEFESRRALQASSLRPHALVA